MEEVLGPVLAIAVLISPFVIRMVLNHQQRMAEIVNGRSQRELTGVQPQIDALSHEVKALRERLNEHVLEREFEEGLDQDVPPPLKENLHERRV